VGTHLKINFKKLFKHASKSSSIFCSGLACSDDFSDVFYNHRFAIFLYTITDTDKHNTQQHPESPELHLQRRFRCLTDALSRIALADTEVAVVGGAGAVTKSCII